jgi:hypothetical protein
MNKAERRELLKRRAKTLPVTNPKKRQYSYAPRPAKHSPMYLHGPVLAEPRHVDWVKERETVVKESLKAELPSGAKIATAVEQKWHQLMRPNRPTVSHRSSQSPSANAGASK